MTRPLVRVALGTCKITSVAAFCFGVYLAQVPIWPWVADEIDSRIDWMECFLVGDGGELFDTALKYFYS